MDSGEVELFARSVRGAAARHSGAELDAALAEIGWHDALDAGLPVIAAVFTALGEHGAVSSAIDDLLAHALGLEAAPDLAVVMPPIGRYDGAVDGRSVTGLATHRARTATRLVLATEAPTVAGASGFDRREVSGMDPHSGWVEVTGTTGPADPATPKAWSDALVLGQLAVATELTALSRAMLGLAREHAVSRVQFGRAVGSFQAVRHKLADAYIAIESAQAAVTAGWEAPSAYPAVMAKAIAGRAARTTAKHAQQVLAGMGFTAEHGFHVLMKRSMVLDHLLGASATLCAEAGQAAVDRRAVPPMLAL